MSSGMGTAQGQAGTSGMMGQTGTGVPDPVYDIVSMLYHALEGGTSLEQYIRDAQQAGDNDLVAFFQKSHQDYRQCAQQAQQLLAQRLQNPPTH
jgi:hypothetical protein